MVSTSGGIQHIVATPGVLASLLAWEADIYIELTQDAYLVAEGQLFRFSAFSPTVSHTGGFLPGWNIDHDYLESHSHHHATERLGHPCKNTDGAGVWIKVQFQEAESTIANSRRKGFIAGN